MLGGTVLGGTFAGGAWGASAMGADSSGHAEGAERDDDEKLSSKEALKRLAEGNERFVARHRRPPRPERRPPRARCARASTRSPRSCRAPTPGCSPELLFDQGLGDLFVVRSAGQVVDHAVLGSLQYGVAELATPLLVVLGHSRCGAVKATVEAVEKHSKPTGTDIDALVAAIRPSVEEAEELGATEKNILSVSIDMNVERIVEQLKTAPVLSAGGQDCAR